MPKRNHVRGLLFILALWGCDSTVGLDAQSVKITEVIVPNACALNSDGSQIDLSVLMFNQNESITPDTWLVREAKSVKEFFACDESLQTCSAQSFEFKKPGSSKFEQFTKVAAAEGQLSGTIQELGLRVNSLSYEYTGGKEKENELALVTLLIDHSGSLVGEDPLTGAFNNPRAPATDKSGDRVGFFRSLVTNMPENTLFSLIWFNQDFPTVETEFATPTLNREVISGAGIDKINRGAAGTTPLADALLDAKQSVLDVNPDYRRLVVLFTDGVEQGDASNRSNLEEMTQAYAAANIPVIVMELQPPANSDYRLPTGRNPDLVNLACQTGGEYIFLEEPSEMTSDYQRLENIVRARLNGAWRMNTTTLLSGGEFASDNYFVSTDLLITVNDTTLTSSLTRQREDGADDYQDARLWIQKQ